MRLAAKKLLTPGVRCGHRVCRGKDKRQLPHWAVAVAFLVMEGYPILQLRLLSPTSEPLLHHFKAGVMPALELFVLGVLGSDTYQLGVDEDASTILTHDDFLVHLDLHLTLGGNAVKAATTGVALNNDNTQAVAGVLAYALESG